VIASDGFANFPELIAAAGSSATGMYVGTYGIPNAKLPPAGRRFLRELEAGGGEGGPDSSAAYGAQAAEILLDAIASSDRSRSSVTRELFRTNVDDGISATSASTSTATSSRDRSRSTGSRAAARSWIA
jgi:hypothetical protein